MSWQRFSDESPQLAAFGASRFRGRVAYLATIQRDGRPRLHPVTPYCGKGHLFIFIHQESPKGADLQRDGRYALHAAVDDTSGGGGEFLVMGWALRVNDSGLRQLAVMIAGHHVPAEQLLFECMIEKALATEYQDESGKRRPVRQRWP